MVTSPASRASAPELPADGRGPGGAPAASSWGRAGLVALALVAGLSLLLTAFAWPAARSGLHGVPLAVAGPQQAAATVVSTLQQERPGAFSVRLLPDRAAAEAAIRDRQVYGAVVVGQGPPAVLVASAAGPAVAQGLTQLAQAMAAPVAGAPTVRDVVATPADDPRGAALAAGALPLVLGGIITAGALGVGLRGASRRLTAAVAVAVVGGLAMTAILHGWLGALSGSFAAEWGVISLAFGATSVTLLGLEWLLGMPGLGLGAVTVLVLGNPLSGVTSAPEMLPSGWGTLGQLLPPGATATLLRSVAFFDGARAGGPLLVLGCWLLFGAVLCSVAAMRGGRRSA